MTTAAVLIKTGEYKIIYTYDAYLLTYYYFVSFVKTVLIVSL